LTSELGSSETNHAQLAHGETLLLQARYAEVLEHIPQVIVSDQPEFILLTSTNGSTILEALQDLRCETPDLDQLG
jgi:hypothetical protein